MNARTQSRNKSRNRLLTAARLRETVLPLTAFSAGESDDRIALESLPPATGARFGRSDYLP